MRVGILGCGHIAEKMAKTLNAMENAELAAVGSRSIESAEKFAERFGVPRFYGSYAELAADDSLDLIYIATPHSCHYENAALCLEHGRNVLCEKAFTVTADEAEELFRIADSRGSFICEAMWTRFMPMRFTLDRLLAEGVIGDITSLTANLGYSIAHVERLKKPELAGGALLDLGVYLLNFAVGVFGKNITDIRSRCVKNEYGVDLHNSIILTFDGRRTAVLHSTSNAATDRMAVIYGDKGRIEFKNVNNCEGIDVVMNDGSRVSITPPPQISGYEYEVECSLRAIAAGRTECPEMPHEDTLYIMRLMDGLRADWGVEFSEK